MIKTKTLKSLEENSKYQKFKKDKLVQISKQISLLTDKKTYLVDKINELMDETNPKKLDKILQSIIALKKNVNISAKMKKFDILLAKSQETFRKNTILLNNHLRTSFIDIFIKSGLNYLIEKNSILVLDNNFTDKDIKNIKEALREEGFTILSPTSYKNIKGKGNMLV